MKNSKGKEKTEKPGEEVSWSYMPLEKTWKGWHGQMDNYTVDVQIKGKGWIRRSYELVVKDKIELQSAGIKLGVLNRKMIFDNETNLRKVAVKITHGKHTYSLLKRDIGKEDERMDKDEWRKNAFTTWRSETEKIDKKGESYVDSKKEVETIDFARYDVPDISCKIWEVQTEFGDKRRLRSIEFEIIDLKGKKILHPSTTWDANIHITELENTAASFVRQNAVVKAIERETFKRLRMP